MADPTDEQDYFGGLANDLLGKAVIPPAASVGLGATLQQASAAIPTSKPAPPPSSGAAGAPQNGYITAAYYKGLDGNPLGHFGVSVNGGAFYGYDLVPSLGPLPMLGHEPPALLQTLGQFVTPVPGDVELIPASRVPADQIKIPVSGNQAEQARQYMLSQAGPNFYKLPFQTPIIPTRDCVTFGAGALDAAGVKIPHSLFPLSPEQLIRGLHALHDPAQQPDQGAH